jgi:hypothetical protein
VFCGWEFQSEFLDFSGINFRWGFYMWGMCILSPSLPSSNWHNSGGGGSFSCVLLRHYGPLGKNEVN